MLLPGRLRHLVRRLQLEAQLVSQEDHQLVEVAAGDDEAARGLHEGFGLAPERFISVEGPVGQLPDVAFELVAVADQIVHQAVVVARVADKNGVIVGEHQVQGLCPSGIEGFDLILCVFWLHQKVPVDLDDNGTANALLDVIADVVGQGLVAHHQGEDPLLTADGVLRQVVEVGGENEIAPAFVPAQQIGQGRVAAAGGGLFHLTLHEGIAPVRIREAALIVFAVEGRAILRGDIVFLLPGLMGFAVAALQILLPDRHQLLAGLDAGGNGRAGA